MIDSHCHLNFQAFDKDYDRVIEDAQKAGVKIIINAGTQISSSKNAVDLAEKYKNLFAVVGIHPHHADKLNIIASDPAQPESEAIPSEAVKEQGIASSITSGRPPRNDNDSWLKELETLAKHPKVVGIGECGLDYYRYQSNGVVDPTIQKEVFVKHVELAYKLKLPLQIHSRDEKARKEVIEILSSNKNLLQTAPGMFHCMAGSKESLKKVLELGFYVGFDGNITYRSVPPGEPLKLDELAKYAPLDRIVVETDSPYLAPTPYRGNKNEPKYAIIIAEFLAKLKGISYEKVEEQADRNVFNLFKKIKVQN